MMKIIINYPYSRVIRDSFSNEVISFFRRNKNYSQLYFVSHTNKKLLLFLFTTIRAAVTKNQEAKGDYCYHSIESRDKSALGLRSFYYPYLQATMSAIFDFSSVLMIVLLMICTSTYIKEIRPGIFDGSKVRLDVIAI